MFISDRANKYLKAVLLTSCFFFLLWFAFSQSGVHFLNIADEYYNDGLACKTPSNYFTLATENFELGRLLLTISGIFLYAGIIIVFIITGIICRFKKQA